MVCGTFLWCENIKDEGYICCATGDYSKLYEQYGKDEALDIIMVTLAHELSHYFQRINNIELTPIGIERQATTYSSYVMYDYVQIRKDEYE